VESGGLYSQVERTVVTWTYRRWRGIGARAGPIGTVNRKEALIGLMTLLFFLTTLPVATPYSVEWVDER
jgi:hypothetical protein